MSKQLVELTIGINFSDEVKAAIDGALKNAEEERARAWSSLANAMGGCEKISIHRLKIGEDGQWTEWRAGLALLSPEYKEKTGIVVDEREIVFPSDPEAATFEDYVEANEDKKRLAREIDAALGGNAPQPSLCDLVEPARRLAAIAAPGFLHRLVENAFSWAMQDTNYFDPKYSERLVAATLAGMDPKDAAGWRVDLPEVNAKKARDGKPQLEDWQTKKARREAGVPGNGEHDAFMGFDPENPDIPLD